MNGNSIYLDSDLDGRIELALEAYRTADQHRNEGSKSFLYGPEGDQFCRFLTEFLDEIRDEGFDEDVRFSTSITLYEDAWEYYASFAPLLDGGEICPVDDDDDDAEGDLEDW